MAIVLVATDSGCRVFSCTGEGEVELAGRQVCALAPQAGGACLAVVDRQEVWRRDVSSAWSRVAKTDVSLQSITSVEDTIFAGERDQAVMLRIPANGEAERLQGFDAVPGRSEWFAVGPPLGVRALTATADSAAILAAVHVGGVPRSSDQGATWIPTMPVKFDVHEVRAHPSLSHVVAAAAAVGLCVSQDGGRSWSVLTEGLEKSYSLAVALLDDEVLFSIQDGPFAQRSQVWRWRIGEERVEQVRDGLPQWLSGKVDTAHIAAGGGRGAVLDGGGNLWLSNAGSNGWERIATGLSQAYGLLML